MLSACSDVVFSALSVMSYAKSPPQGCPVLSPLPVMSCAERPASDVL
jgi:hypothetical protein